MFFPHGGIIEITNHGDLLRDCSKHLLNLTIYLLKMKSPTYQKESKVNKLKNRSRAGAMTWGSGAGLHVGRRRDLPFVNKQTDEQTDRRTDATENMTFPHLCWR